VGGKRRSIITTLNRRSRVTLLTRLRRPGWWVPGRHLDRLRLDRSRLFFRRRRWPLHLRLRLARLCLLEWPCNDRRFSSENILEKTQEVDDIRALIDRPVAQIGVVDSSVNTDVLARSDGHSLACYHKHHDTLRICRIGMR